MHLESKFNPNTVGNQSKSLGLFQLHRGGLAPRDLTNKDLKNAETNTRIAISNMTSAYNRGLQKSLKGSDLLGVQPHIHQLKILKFLLNENFVFFIATKFIFIVFGATCSVSLIAMWPPI